MSLVFKTPQSTLNTTTGLGQNIGSGCPECPECPEVDLTTGSAEYTENGEYTLTPEGDGFSSVDVTVNVDVTTPYNNGVAAGEAAQKAKLESATFVSNGTYTKEDGYNSVTVNVPSDINNQEKNATPTTSSQEIVADNGYSGLSKVTISGVTSAIDSNITAGNIKEGVTILGVTGTVDPTPDLQAKNVTPTTSQQVIEADSPNYGLSSVTVAGVTSAIDSNISAGNIKKDVAILGVTGTYDPQPTLQDKTVTPTTSQQVISADSGYDGLDEVTVGAVTSTIDQNIVAGNIKSGVTILGVQGTVQEGITPTGNINITDTSSTNVTNYATAQVVDANLVASNIKNGVSILGVNGSYDPQPDLETKTVTYTANDTYTIIPTAGKDGISSVEVTVNVSGGGGTQCPDWSSIGWDCSDVTASGLAADLAVTAELLEGYDETDPNSNTYWQNRHNLVYAPNITINEGSSDPYSNLRGFFSGCIGLVYVPDLKFEGKTPSLTYLNPHCSNLFGSCISLQQVTLDLSSDDPNSSGYVTGANAMFSGCSNIRTVTLTNTNGIVSCYDMFRDCAYLTTVNIATTANVTDMHSMFYHCDRLVTAPNLDTSNVTSMVQMFHYAINLETVPLYSAVKVKDVNNMFGSNSSSATKKLTTVGGFTNLGKAFVSTDAATSHLLSFQYNTVLTKQSIMNIINNLSAPDDANVSDATLKLSTTSYALLDAEDIAIATAKNWAVVSA